MAGPLHPLVVHFPIALSFLLPILALVVAYFMKQGKFSPSTWWLIAGLQVFSTVAGYVALQTGEQEEHVVSRVTGKLPIAEHEERAEMFIAGSVAATALAVMAPFVRLAVQPYIQLVTVVLLVGNSYLALRTGEAGGDIVYKYGAPNAYISAQNVRGEEAAVEGEGLLPTPGKNTSESAYPTEDEGTKSDDDEDEDKEPEESPTT